MSTPQERITAFAGSVAAYGDRAQREAKTIQRMVDTSAPPEGIALMVDRARMALEWALDELNWIDSELSAMSRMPESQ